jgi:glycosyltransferase involved in cell wall biosynthesis
MKLISFVIPVFRNEGSIHLTHEKIAALMGTLAPRFDYEFVFVNDGSDDGSLAEIREVCRRDPKVRYLSLSRNFGQVAAVIAGLRAARGDAIVNLSADLQEPVELIGTMIQEWEAGSQIVVCHRISREDSLVANATSKVFYRLMRLANPRMPEGGFDFLLIDRQPNDVLKNLKERNRFFQGDVLWLGFSVKFLPYERQKRTIGKSQWSLSKKVKYFIDGLLNTSYLPIRFMSLMGLVTAFSGLLYAVLIAYARLIHRQPYIGWAPLMIIILLVGGVLMTMLGVIGEYVWRIYDEARERPLYIVQERGGGEPLEAGGRVTHLATCDCGQKAVSRG